MVGCVPSVRSLFRRLRGKEDACKKKDDFVSRPLHDSIASTSTAFSDVEKPLLVTSRSTARSISSTLPAAIAALRPRAKPTHSAYRAPAKRSSSRHSSDSTEWTGSLSSTEVSDLSDDLDRKAKDEGVEILTEKEHKAKAEDVDDPTEKESKAKEENVDDPAQKERLRKAEAARRKAEEEREEHLDFLQMM